VEAALARIAVHSGRDVVEVKKFYQEHDLMGILRRELRDERTMKLLLDQAEIGTTALPAEAPEAAVEKE
jgi:hypothetical protein